MELFRTRLIAVSAEQGPYVAQKMLHEAHRNTCLVVGIPIHALAPRCPKSDFNFLSVER